MVEQIRRDHADGSVLPIDVSGMGTGEVDQIRLLWTQLLSQRGQLKVDGTDNGFAKSIWAQLAKLIQTRTGRAVIEYLDAPPREGEPRKEVIIVPELPDELKQSEESESSYAVSTPKLADSGTRVTSFRRTR